MSVYGHGRYFGGWVDEPGSTVEIPQLPGSKEEILGYFVTHHCRIEGARMQAGGWYWTARCQYEGCRCHCGDINWSDVVDWAIAHARWNRRVRAA